jgi:hypothetical protein
MTVTCSRYVLLIPMDGTLASLARAKPVLLGTLIS